ncbi:hypothetical protein [Tropicibacter oceani]|uniref:Uncharacterized protein n=1 Tax=Tropicibacter oceani TaxID=3058420 RepID=A0ABY8QEF0_9RHOB|nr:hypothetical protein [Tropicibacter oceani]WGW02890.1 hypothetical protein QF118_13205 [Tropicibacter oceani]
MTIFSRKNPVVSALALAGALWAATAIPGTAQEVVGTAVIAGETVTLYSDRTWAYSDAKAASCTPLAKGLNFCGLSRDWVRSSVTPTGITAQFSRDASQWAQTVVEEIGADQGVTLALLRQAALGYAAQAAGTTPAGVPILFEEKTDVDGHDASTLAYFVDLNGTPIVMANTMVILPKRALQFQTYVIGAREMSDQHRAFHAEFLDVLDIAE